MLRLVLGAHLACAFGATALFWIPIVAPKGGPLHKGAGRLYARLIYITALTGAPLAVAMFLSAPDEPTRQTAAFLGYLVTILVQPVYHGVRVVRLRAQRSVASPLHTTLALMAIAAGIAIGAAALLWQQWPFLLVSPIGPLMGGRALVYDSHWREEHIIAMVMSGIAVHTAMLVFGTSRTLHLTLSGPAAYVPWLLPMSIGLPLLVWEVRRERRAHA